jgi:hypothetical protein
MVSLGAVTGFPLADMFLLSTETTWPAWKLSRLGFAIIFTLLLEHKKTSSA